MLKMYIQAEEFEGYCFYCNGPLRLFLREITDNPGNCDKTRGLCQLCRRYYILVTYCPNEKCWKNTQPPDELLIEEQEEAVFD